MKQEKIRQLLTVVALVVLGGIILYQLQLPGLPPPGGEPLGAAAVKAGRESESVLLQEDRLPGDVRPRAYRLRLTIDPAKERFTGRVEIDITARTPQNHLWLHAKDLMIERAEVLTSGGETIRVLFHQVDAAGLTRLTLLRPLDTAQATIAIEYSARFNNGLEGLYRVKRGDDWYALTQFQPTAARLVFPSFDEPEFKTPFSITVRTLRDLVVVGNAPVAVERVLDDGGKIVVLAPTRPLPTYLVALAIGPFDVVTAPAIPPNGVRAHSIPLRGIAPRGQGGELAFALGETAEFVAALEAYTTMPYAYEKIDLVAVPAFAAEARESPGALFYRDAVILVDPGAPLPRVREFYDVHVQQLAAQWFGGLVTPKWWDDAWASVGLAAVTSARLLAGHRPALAFDRQIQRGALAAMASDSSAAARPVRQLITTDSDIDSAFDPVTEQKGAAVLAMFEQYMGPSHFRAAVRHYLRAHGNGTASAEDFVAALDRSYSDEMAKGAVSSFLDQTGVPELNVDWSCQSGGVNISAAQRRYVPLGVTLPGEAPSWQTPFCFRVLDGEAAAAPQCVLIRRPTQTFYLRQRACPQAIVPNAGGNGYYRWTLPAGKQRFLVDNLSRLRGGEVLSFTDSLSAAYGAGRVMTVDYLALIGQLVPSADWDAATLPMADLRFLLHYALPAAAEAQSIARAKIADIYRVRLEVGLGDMGSMGAGGTAGEREFRRRLLEFFVLDLGDPTLSEEFSGRGLRYAGYGRAGRDRAAVAPDLGRLALAAAVIEVGLPFTDHLFALLAATENPADREDILAALSVSPEPSVIARLIELLAAPVPDDRGDGLGDDEVRFLLSALGENAGAREPLWLWIKDHLDTIVGRLPDLYKGEVVLAARGFCSEESRADVDAFFNPLVAGLTGGARHLAVVLEKIDHCVALKTAVAADAAAAFGIEPAATDHGPSSKPEGDAGL